MATRNAIKSLGIAGGALLLGALFLLAPRERSNDPPAHYGQPPTSSAASATALSRHRGKGPEVGGDPVRAEEAPTSPIGQDTGPRRSGADDVTPPPGITQGIPESSRDQVIGKVLGEDNHPITGAEISFVGRGGKQAVSALSDSDGEFRLRLEPGEYGAEATALGYLPDRRSLKASGGAQSVEFVLRAAGVVFGEVEGLSESDAELPLVRAVPVLSSGLAEDRAEQARVGVDSTYEVSGLEEGTYQIYLDGDSADNGVEVFLRAGDRVRADLRAAVGMIEGVMKLPTGRTLQAFLLHLSYGETGRQVRLDVPLAGAGRFSVKGLPVGKVLATASAQGMATSPHSSLTLRPGVPAQVKFDLAGSEVKGTVVDARTGEPLAGASVSVVTLDPQWHRVDSMTVVATTTSDQSGSFDVSGLASGEYVAVARSPRHAMSTIRFSSNGSDDVPLVVALEAGLDVQVVVLDAAGRREPGAWVMIDRQPPIQGTSYSELTNDQGVASFSDFSSGEFLITVLHGQSEVSRAQGVTPSRTQQAVEISPASHRIVIHQEG